MDKKHRAFLIDPEKRSITEVDYNGNYKEIYRLLDIDCFTAVQIDDVNCVFVDDEGLFKNPRYFFTLKGYHQPLAGKGLVLGTDADGESVSTTLELEEIAPLIGFREYSVKGWTETQSFDAAIYGQKGFAIVGAQPIFGPPEKNGEKK